MASVALVLNRRRTPTTDRSFTAVVTAANQVALEPGDTVTEAISVTGSTFPVGARVLVLVTSHGNYILGGLP